MAVMIVIIYLLEWLLLSGPPPSGKVRDIASLACGESDRLAHLSKYVLANFSMGMFRRRLFGPRGTRHVGQERI